MSPFVKPYNLKDSELFSSEKESAYSVWIPDCIYIVLGRANQPEDSVVIEEAEKDSVEILKRPSGGETVLLSPRMLVLSYKFRVWDSIKIHDYFKIINTKILSAMEEAGIKDVQFKGISDLAIGDKKILGSSMYKRQQTGFYHAVLNVSESTELMERYLKHPKREPDYRHGRPHGAFVTSLYSEGYELKPDDLLSVLESALKSLSLN